MEAGMEAETKGSTDYWLASKLTQSITFLRQSWLPAQGSPCHRKTDHPSPIN